MKDLGGTTLGHITNEKPPYIPIIYYNNPVVTLETAYVRALQKSKTNEQMKQ